MVVKGRAGSPPRAWILAIEPYHSMWAGVHARGLSVQRGTCLCLSSPGVPPGFFALELPFAPLFYVDSMSTHVGRTIPCPCCRDLEELLGRKGCRPSQLGQVPASRSRWVVALTAPTCPLNHCVASSPPLLQSNIRIRLERLWRRRILQSYAVNSVGCCSREATPDPDRRPHGQGVQTWCLSFFPAPGDKLSRPTGSNLGEKGLILTHSSKFSSVVAGWGRGGGRGWG